MGLEARLCGNSCIYARREHFLPAGSSQQSSLQPCQPFVEEERQSLPGCQADSPCCLQRLCGDALAAPGELEGGWEPNWSLMIVPDMCQSKSPCKFGSAWFPWLSKLSSSSRLQKMCIIRKTRGEKLTACRASLWWLINHASFKRAPGIWEIRHPHLPKYLTLSWETKTIRISSSLPYTWVLSRWCT